MLGAGGVGAAQRQIGAVDQADHRQAQQPVEDQQLAHRRTRPGLLHHLQRRDVHSVFELPGVKDPGLPKNHCERISRATGAAETAPKPPFSTVTTTTIGLLVADGGTKQAYQAVSVSTPFSKYCAVPVLPYTCSGKLPNTSAEVPPGEDAASRSPCMIVARSSGLRLRWRLGGGWMRCSTTPSGSWMSMP